MSWGNLNIGILSEEARPVRDCWMADLVIRTIAGNYLPDLYPHVLQELKEQYPHLDVRTTQLQSKAAGIAFGGENAGYGPAEHQKKIDPSISIGLPPGWYIIWARVSHRSFGETKRVAVSITGGQEVYVNLVLSTPRFPSAIALPSALSSVPGERAGILPLGHTSGPGADSHACHELRAFH